MRRLSLLCVLAVGFGHPDAFLLGAPEPGPRLSVAAAANLVYALDALDADFTASHPGVKVVSSTGASGSLVAQISQGAPFDVFLSADASFTKALVKTGNADPGSLSTFAVGRLVLWTVKPAVPMDSVAGAVRSAAVQRLSIANVDTAPFGRAAKQAMIKLGIWGEAQPKVIFGESISQAAQFVQTGAADAGFVALSVVRSPTVKSKGQWIDVPPGLYDPLEQCAIITRHGSTNPVAAEYVAYLKSPGARRILDAYGYASR